MSSSGRCTAPTWGDQTGARGLSPRLYKLVCGSRRVWRQERLGLIYGADHRLMLPVIMSSAEFARSVGFQGREVTSARV